MYRFCADWNNRYEPFYWSNICIVLDQTEKNFRNCSEICVFSSLYKYACFTITCSYKQAERTWVHCPLLRERAETHPSALMVRSCSSVDGDAAIFIDSTLDSRFFNRNTLQVLSVRAAILIKAITVFSCLGHFAARVHSFLPPLSLLFSHFFLSLKSAHWTWNIFKQLFKIRPTDFYTD